MAFPVAMMHEDIWFERPKYEEAKENYQLFLTNNLSLQLSQQHHDQSDGLLSKATNAMVNAASEASSVLISEIAKARDSIKQSLSGMANTVTHAVTAESDSHINNIESENKQLRKLVEDLAKQVATLEIRVSKLEGGSTDSGKPSAPAKQEADDDDDDFDLFGDDDDDEEETAEEQRRKEELVAKYKEKKSKKPALIPKSSILLDVKPWDDETDMKEVEKLVRGIELDGLVWGAAKLIPLAYGIKKLQILCIVEDDKVGTDILEEKITAFEDHVQSIDIAAFNKI